MANKPQANDEPRDDKEEKQGDDRGISEHGTREVDDSGSRGVSEHGTRGDDKNGDERAKD